MRLVYPRIESRSDDASEKLLKHAARRRMQIAPEIAKANFVIHADTPYYASLRRCFFSSPKRSVKPKPERD